jgi:diaminohydroxyphosphoribosylaminopyrimidine deaminase/5-amino-6-(5-phosphoribosylamino)uracil reductase
LPALNVYEKYITRCIQLAKLGAGYVTPNPMVGAVLVHDGKIIAEGYHEKFGGPHAEPNCISSVKEKDQKLISSSTLYVSLEPCVHFGKTPPCTDLIIQKKIPRVVIGCRDPFPEVRGKGIEKLMAAGVEVVQGILEDECKELNKRFFVFHTEHRPYIILKWAQTSDGFIATSPQKQGAFEDSTIQRLFITNEYTNRLVHKWRSEEQAILIGTNTAIADDPQLTTRLWKGKSPTRLVVDMDLSLPSHLHLFDKTIPTIVFNTRKHEENKELMYYQVTEDVSLVHQVCNALYQLQIQSVIVEGGARLIQSFIDEGVWDEARVICNRQLAIGKGLNAPQLTEQTKIYEETISSDNIEFFKRV